MQGKVTAVVWGGNFQGKVIAIVLRGNLQGKVNYVIWGGKLQGKVIDVLSIILMGEGHLPFIIVFCLVSGRVRSLVDFFMISF